MKKIFKNSTRFGIVGVVMMVLLSSFVLMRGGHSYTISINGKEVGQYYVGSKRELPSVSLKSADKLTVYYNECGKIGVSRKLSIRNDQSKILKEWKFDDNLQEHTPMTILTKSIEASGNVGLYYTSKEVTTPQKLATVLINNAASASAIK